MFSHEPSEQPPHLASYKKPKRVEFTEALPLNAAMKVVKGELRAVYGKSVRYE